MSDLLVSHHRVLDYHRCYSHSQLVVTKRDDILLVELITEKRRYVIGGSVGGKARRLVIFFARII